MFTLIIGLPNSGKTSYSNNYENVIHADNYKTKEVKEFVSKADGDIVVEGIYILRSDREPLIKSYNGLKKCVVMDTHVDVCISRENRGRFPNLVTGMNEWFEIPTFDEGWDIIEIRR